MTKEELKKEAKGYVKAIAFVYETEVVRKIVCMYAEQAYLASADPREKRIAELESVINTNEFYQNGYKQGKLEESRKREVEIFEIQGEVELRDVRIFDLNEKVGKLEKENADLKKSCDETQELLDKQIEATYKLDKENAELKEELEKHKWNNIFLEDCAVYDKEITEEYKTLQERIAELEKENKSLTSIKNIYIGDLLKAK